LDAGSQASRILMQSAPECQAAFLPSDPKEIGFARLTERTRRAFESRLEPDFGFGHDLAADLFDRLQEGAAREHAHAQRRNGTPRSIQDLSRLFDV
jgi:hypothetical protein